MRAELIRVLNVMNVGLSRVVDVLWDVRVRQFDDVCTSVRMRSASTGLG